LDVSGSTLTPNLFAVRGGAYTTDYAFFVSGSGNVGIGLSTPTCRLDVRS
jgi:hypothetical protein